MNKKYIKCNCCGRKIPMGSDVWYHSGYCDTYCSAECYADCFAEQGILDEELAEDHRCEVFDDEQRKKELQNEIEYFSTQLEKVKQELEDLKK